MRDELTELKRRIASLPDEELLRIVNNKSDGYRPDAVEIASRELETRGPISYDPNNEPESTHRDRNCRACGGPTREGALTRGKEVLITFSDNTEERYVAALVCTECGEVRFVVDFQTDVLR